MTSPDCAALSDLLARVEGVTEGDPDLGLELVRLLLSRAARQGRTGNPALSLDAAMDLAERALPGWAGSVSWLAGKSQAALHDYREPCGPTFEGDGATPALSVCAALLRALISQDQSTAKDPQPMGSVEGPG